MKHEDFNFPQHGFAGHLAEPDEGSDRAVIVIMGGPYCGYWYVGDRFVTGDGSNVI